MKDDLDVYLAQWDGYCAGCIQVFIENDGILDAYRVSVLEKSLGKLENLRAGFGPDNPRHQLYIDKLLAISRKVLAACS